MEILHINAALLADKFYSSMFNSINTGSRISQTVYTPYSELSYTQKDYEALNNFEDDINIILSPIKTNYDRIFYYKKINKYFFDIQSKAKIQDFNLIHAHSLFTDGGVAYKLFEEYHIPYVVAVRTTDTDFFMKYFPYLKHFAKQILDNASGIIFINPSIKETLENKIADKYFFEKIEKKSYIIPNGVNEFWLKGMRSKENKKVSTINLIQVSRLIKTKNVDKTIKCVKELLNNNFDVKLDIVGEGHLSKKLKNLVTKLNLDNNITFHGFLSSKEKLRDLYYEANVFVLPSYAETFGISYLEAMSQGTPVVGVVNSGIYGFLSKKYIGEFVENVTPKDIMNAIIKIISNYGEYEKNCNNSLEPFCWNTIARRYIDIYERKAFIGINSSKQGGVL